MWYILKVANVKMICDNFFISNVYPWHSLFSLWLCVRVRLSLSLPPFPLSPLNYWCVWSRSRTGPAPRSWLWLVQLLNNIDDWRTQSRAKLSLGGNIAQKSASIFQSIFQFSNRFSNLYIEYTMSYLSQHTHSQASFNRNVLFRE